MATLDALAEKYDAFVSSDGGGFQRKARVLQSMWRAEQGYDAGYHDKRPLGSRLPMPWAEESLANYLNDTIREVVRTEVLGPKGKKKLYTKPRIFNDLLSSQPLCFNLFAELQCDLSLATSVFQAMLPNRMANIIAIEFEVSPGRGDPRYTGDASASDVFVEYKSINGKKGFLAIEVKYHENLAGKAATHKDRYEEVAREMNCFRPESMDLLKEQPLQQIWRDHLLAGSMILAGDYDEGAFVFLYPRDNCHCSEAVVRYRQCLTSSASFLDWTLEDLSGAIAGITNANWIKAVHDRYFDWAKLEKA